MKYYYLYMMTNKSNRVLHTGVTNDLQKRVTQHQNKSIEGFTKKYNINKLVYYEYSENIEAIILREKQIKGWVRHKKDALIELENPAWQDLSKKIMQ